RDSIPPRNSTSQLREHAMSSGADWVETLATIWSDVNEADSFPEVRPLFAHYTSIGTLEGIMRSDEVWFSNPLYMNDLEELRFGLNEGINALRSHVGLKSAFGSEARYEEFVRHFENSYSEFSEKHAFDTYVLCFAEHDPSDNDGQLSMWRGYGGNGGGAAIVFDSAAIRFAQNSPLIIAKVTYLSAADRRIWIERKLDQFTTLVEQVRIPDRDLYYVAKGLLERFKVFALFTKHVGFKEEKEWRIVYLRERDENKHLDGMLHYFVGPRGLEPKLKFKVQPISGLTMDDLSLAALIDRIILGPTVSNPLSRAAIDRMLLHCGKSDLVGKVVTSTTPYRAA
ncbi:MAG TPA: DUF2971 domain-containing protein, partial [Burkholderiaceae bacterium]